jgi:hypothetical protein
MVWLESVIGLRRDMSVLFVASNGEKHNVDIVEGKKKQLFFFMLLTFIS